MSESTRPERAQCSATTAKGERCKGRTCWGLDVCSTHSGHKRNGRKSKLNAQSSERILAVLRAGGYDETACAAAGVSKQQFYEWLRRGRAGEGPFDAFLVEVLRAQADGEARNVMLVAQQAQNSWQAAAWLLERRHPERWGRPSQRNTDAPAVATETVSTDDPFAEVDELAARRRRT